MSVKAFIRIPSASYIASTQETARSFGTFRPESHTESSPCVVDGRVFFGAGDDGVFCLDAVSGRRIWHFQGPHVDSSPAVVGGRVYAGSGYGDHYMFCLDSRTGNVVWKTVADFPAFASPTVSGRHVFFGIGTGDMLASSDSAGRRFTLRRCRHRADYLALRRSRWRAWQAGSG